VGSPPQGLGTRAASESFFDLLRLNSLELRQSNDEFSSQLPMGEESLE